MKRDSPFWRLLYAAIGLACGNAALRILLWRARDLVLLYALFYILGWALVGVPIALGVPASFLSRVPWPIRFLIGATLGPIALLLILILLFEMGGGRPGAFSLDHTETLWPMSVLVSLVSFLVYTSFLRRSTCINRQ